MVIFMCRAGGRRCPGHSSGAYKKAAALRRKNNRNAKKNLLTYLQNNGTDVSEISKLSPSQLVVFADSAGIDREVFGVKNLPATSKISEAMEDRITKVLSSYADSASNTMRTNINNADINASVNKVYASADEFVASKDFENLAANVVNSIVVDGNERSRAAYKHAFLWQDNVENEKIVNILSQVDVDRNQWREISIDLEKKAREYASTNLRTPDSAVNKVIDNIGKIEYQDAASAISIKDKDDFVKKNNLKSMLKLNSNDRIESVNELKNGLYTVTIFNDRIYRGKTVLLKKFDKKNELTNAAGFTKVREMATLQPVAVNLTDGLNEEEVKEFYRSERGRELSTLSEVIDKSKKVRHALEATCENGDRKNKGFDSWSEEEKSELRLRTSASVYVYQAAKEVEYLAASARQETYAHKAGIVNSENSANKSKITIAREIGFGLATHEKLGKDELKSLQGKYSYDPIYDVDGSLDSEDREFMRKESQDATNKWDEYLTSNFSKEEVSEIKAITYEYSGDGYTDYSRAARAKYSCPENEHIAKVEKLDNFIKASESKVNNEHRMIYRGAASPKGISTSDYYDSIELGQVMTTTKLTSTTRSTETVQDFKSDVHMVFRTKKGMDIASDEFVKFDIEREVLVPSGTSFVCVDKHKDAQGQVTLFFEDKS